MLRTVLWRFRDTQTMIFVLLDDNTLDVHEDGTNLNGPYETIDVENGEYEFFDAEGYELRPRFIRSATRRKFFGLIPYGDPVTFELIRGDCKKAEFLARLTEIAAVNSNKWFKTPSEVVKFLSENCAAV